MAEPPAVEIVNGTGRSAVVLTCEHASHYMPEVYGGLGLAAKDRLRHIGWDIGAANVARRLSRLIDAPLFLAGYSRLLIDCNRPLGAPTSIPEESETTVIPGNRGLSAEARDQRAASFFWPFQNAVAAHLDRRDSEGRPAIIVGIHSFTPVFKGAARPWHGGVLFRKSVAFGKALVAALTASGSTVAANEPYCIEDDSDYTVPVHGERRGLEAVLVEMRQDLIADDAGACAWADRLAAALRGAA
jgi:predicted N-formylglutamate amidohydrolase